MILALLASGAPAGAGPDGALRVAAAASLREPMTQIADAFTRAGGPPVRLHFGASSALAAQLRAGAPLDVLASADERTVLLLEDAGLAAPEDRTAFATNRLLVLRSRDLEGLVQSPADLASDRVRHFAIPPDSVPAGHYAREWLLRAGLLAVLEPRFVVTPDVRAALAAVDAGHADVAIVYATDAPLAKRAAPAFGIPGDQQPRIVYAATRIQGADGAEEALRFLSFLRGPAAADLLREAGFGPPPAAPAPSLHETLPAGRTRETPGAEDSRRGPR